MSHFRKSWGTEPAGDGRWRFNLWAPGLEEAAVSLKGARHALDKDADGWFRAELPAAPGDAYAFLMKDLVVPDPAARAQIKSVLGPSRIVDPRAYEWRTEWEGRPWEEVVLYELHTGTFSETGDFDGVIQKLDHLAGTGITAVELCPIGQFPGNRGWGYDGVLPYAPHVAYGGPEGLKRLVDAAHERGLMMFLDVVYNHFGPEGNFLPAYAPEFFHQEWKTPWGAGIAFDRDPVRRFFIENALFWLTEYRFDGLRLDAIDSIRDPSKPSFLEELAREVRAADLGRPVHLTTEDERNITWLHERDDRGGRRSIPPSGTTTSTMSATFWRRGRPRGITATIPTIRGRTWRPPCRTASCIRGSRRPGKGGAAGRALGASAAHGLRQLHPEPRPDRELGVRRAADDACALGGGGGADGAAAAVAHDPDAVHGRGVRRDAPLPVLRRL